MVHILIRLLLVIQSRVFIGSGEISTMPISHFFSQDSRPQDFRIDKNCLTSQKKPCALSESTPLPPPPPNWRKPLEYSFAQSCPYNVCCVGDRHLFRLMTMTTGKGNFWCSKWVRSFICTKITKQSYFYWCF